MNSIISNCAQAEVSNRILDILCAYIIGWWQSQLRHQNQNPAERRINDIKHTVSTAMD